MPPALALIDGAASRIVQIGRQIDWQKWTVQLWAPLGALKVCLEAIDRNLTIADTHPSPSTRALRLDLALQSIASARNRLDEIELAATQALEQARRDTLGGDAA